jgi:8-oxo-dGTP diphosphatase
LTQKRLQWLHFGDILGSNKVIERLAMNASYENPIVTTDVVVLTLHEGRLKVLLALRDAQAPIAPNTWTLPGGFVHVDEDTDLTAAAMRVLKAKTGGQVSYLEQLYTFGNATRDSRGWSLSVAYLALVPAHEVMGLDETRTRWEPVLPVPALPFDHSHIVEMALTRLRGKSAYSSLPAFLLPEKFTLPELMAVYEAVLDQKLDQSTFRRKIETQGTIAKVRGKRKHEGAGRPATLYRLTQPALHDFGRVLMSERS